jgi:serine protease inhibitor
MFYSFVFLSGIQQRLHSQNQFQRIREKRRSFVTKTDFNCGIQIQNENRTLGLAKKVNDWVSEFTKGKLASLVDSESLKNSVMLLVNVVYFHGLWRFPFNDIIVKDFHVEPNVNVTKEFVEQTAEFYYFYSKSLGAKILRLPYEGRHFSMFFILPFQFDGLNELVDKLDSAILSNEVDNMEPTNVHVVLPKFRFDSSMKLNSVIKAVKLLKLSKLVEIDEVFFHKLGITEIFEDSATLSFLSNGKLIELF